MKQTIFHTFQNCIKTIERNFQRIKILFEICALIIFILFVANLYFQKFDFSEVAFRILIVLFIVEAFLTIYKMIFLSKK